MVPFKGVFQGNWIPFFKKQCIYLIFCHKLSILYGNLNVLHHSLRRLRVTAGNGRKEPGMQFYVIRM